MTPEEAAKEAAAGGLSIRLTPVYGITIPVFVRKGRLEASAALANPRFVKDGEQTFVELDMSRTGQRSVFGMVEGKTNHELATEMGFSVSTIRHETMRIYQALAVSDRKEAAKKALMLSLV